MTLPRRRRPFWQSVARFTRSAARVTPPFFALALTIFNAGLAGQADNPSQRRPNSPSPEPNWLEWGGSRRNFTSDSGKLLNSWPEAGPRRLWVRELGAGHSSILKEGDRLYTMYRPYRNGERGRWSEDEIVIALDAATGRTLWERRYRSSLEGMSIQLDAAGPHSTPLIVGPRLFATGTNKEILALDKQTGKVLWSHDLVKEFNAPPEYLKMPNSGYNCSPLAYKDMIIVTAGGAGQTVMAFRQDDGRLMWRGGDFAAAPASPILITVQGQDQVVVFAAEDVVGIDPNTGAVLWSHPHVSGKDMNATTPIWSEDKLLFISSAFDGGSRVLEVSKSGVKELWFSKKMRVYFGTVVRIGDYYYGSSVHFGPAFMTAINARTGDVAWQDRRFARSNFLYADGKLIIVDEDGNLGLATVSPQGFKVLAKTPLLNSLSWSVPTLVGTKLYLRDRVSIMALDLGAPVGTAASSK